MSNEANTCRKYVEPKLKDAGWEDNPHNYTEQYYFTDGKIRPKNKRKPRSKRKFADYLLLYNGDFPIAVIEAKRKYCKTSLIIYTNIIRCISFIEA